VACRGDDVQPLLGCYAPRAIDPLRSGLPAEAPVRELVASLHPRMLDVGDPELLFNINSPEDLLHAAAILDGRARASRPPASRT
jgi:molybdopterin-guanine dinucleotide biosynthesis protein A